MMNAETMQAAYERDIRAQAALRDQMALIPFDLLTDDEIEQSLEALRSQRGQSLSELTRNFNANVREAREAKDALRDAGFEEAAIGEALPNNYRPWQVAVWAAAQRIIERRKVKAN